MGTNNISFPSLKILMNNFKLKDTWRERNGNTKEYSWNKVYTQNTNKNRGPTDISSMRLDYFLTTPKINLSKKTHIFMPQKSPLGSDHSPVILVIKCPWIDVNKNFT